VAGRVGEHGGEDEDDAAHGGGAGLGEVGLGAVGADGLPGLQAAEQLRREGCQRHGERERHERGDDYGSHWSLSSLARR